MSRALERSWRQERAGIVAVLARRLGDLALAEDCTQEAFAAAAERWPRDGEPANPGAWLMTVAWRRALDARRRERPQVELSEVTDPGRDDEPGPALKVDDDTLGLVLACCHPALAPDVCVALTLRHVVGLTRAEIAAGLLLPEATLGKRLVRARRKLKDGGVSFALPDPAELPARLEAARTVIALIFTEGHHASGGGAPVRVDLCDEAVWLARELHRLSPDEETTGLLALLLLQHARTPARVDGPGRLIPFAEQQRERWDHAAIAQGRALLATTGRTTPGRFQLQAAIALVHLGDGPTPWGHVSALYRALLRRDPSPVVALHHAYAVGRSRGPAEGLALLEALADDAALAGGPLLHAARADLLERGGDRAAAADAWAQAVERCENEAQLAALARRAAEAVLSAPPLAS